MSSLAVRSAIWMIRVYQRVSRVLPPVCRFYPTCSRYAVEALTVHGFWRGLWLAVTRIGRCHPFHPGGLDPVPPARSRALPPPETPAGGSVG